MIKCTCVANLMIASADAAAYSAVIDVLLRYQMIANRRKTRNSHLIDTHNQNQSYGICLNSKLVRAI